MIHNGRVIGYGKVKVVRIDVMSKSQKAKTWDGKNVPKSRLYSLETIPLQLIGSATNYNKRGEPTSPMTKKQLINLAVQLLETEIRRLKEVQSLVK